MPLKRLVALLMLASLILVSCSNTSHDKSDREESSIDSLNFEPSDAGLQLPDGFQVVLVARDIGAARHIAVRDNGDIYIALNAVHDGHCIVALRDTTDDGRADIVRYFGELIQGTGIGIFNGYLYYGSDTAVVRYKLQEGELLPELKPELVVSLPVQHQHEARSLAFDNKGHMFVNVGAPSNACQVEDRTKGSPGQRPCPLLEKHAAVWMFDADKLHQSEENGGERYITGIRNCVALDWNPNSGKLYALMHGRDQLHQLYPQYYSAEEGAALPAEEFLLLKQGADYGWPYVYWDQFKKQFMVAPEYGGDGKQAAPEGKYEPPILAFPGHWAPNGLLFYTGKQFPGKYRNGAFVAFHGSWNRAPEPQKGYKVVYVPFDGDVPAGDYEVFADGFAQTSGSIQSPGDAKYRPCGLAQGPDGSLYITDDAAGTVFRVIYTGK